MSVIPVRLLSPAIVAVLLCVVSLRPAGALLAAEPPPATTAVDIDVCVAFPLFSTDEAGLPSGLAFPATMFWTSAAFLAIDHVNVQNCTLLGKGCESLIALEGGKHLKLHPRLYNLEDLTPRLVAPAVMKCTQAGGKYIIAGSTSGQSDIMAQLAAIYGQFVASSLSTSPSLSDTWLTEIGVRKAALLHTWDLFGTAYATNFLKEAEVHDLDVQDISLGALQTETSLLVSAESLIGSGAKFVVWVGFYDELFEVLKLVKELKGEEAFKEHVWILGTDDAAQIVGHRPDEESQALIANIIGVSGFLNSTKMAALRDATQAYEAEAAFDMDQAFALGEYYKGDDTDSCHQPAEESLSARDLAQDPEARLTGNLSFIPAELELQMVEMLSGAADSLLADNIFAHSYDVVWAAAAAIASAMRSSGTSEPPSGEEVMAQVTQGSVPGFDGTVGWHEWDANGDPKMSELKVKLTSYSTRPGADGPTVDTVATWTKNEGIEFMSAAPVIWPDGSVYPEIPDDGYETVTLRWHLVVIPCVAVLAVLGLLLAWLVRKNRQLQSHVNSLTSSASQQLDMQSPLAKAIELLDEFSSGQKPRLTRAEAKEMRDMLQVHGNDISSPMDLAGQLARDEALTPDMIHYLVTMSNDTQVASRTSSADPSTSARGLSNFTNSMESVPPGLVCGDGSEDLTASMAEVAMLKLPDDFADKIGVDPFLDTVTPNSVLHMCVHPLGLIVRESIPVLKLSRVITRSGCSRLIQFAIEIEKGYPPGGYHSKRHVSDVTSRLVAILGMSGIAATDPLVLLGGVVAAVAHDYEHPQSNNAFMISQGTKMAFSFNDQHVAENHSLWAALTMSKREDLNFWEDIRGKKQKKMAQTLRSTIIDIVLGTDMSRHFDIVGQFQAKVVQDKDLTAIPGGEQKWRAMDANQKRLTIQIAMKVADIGHCATERDQHLTWLNLLQEEMFAQGDKEREADLPVSPMMDRTKTGVVDANAQIGFYNVFVLPMYESFVSVFPECQSLLDKAKENLAWWASERRVSIQNSAGPDLNMKSKASNVAAPSFTTSREGGSLLKLLQSPSGRMGKQ